MKKCTTNIFALVLLTIPVSAYAHYEHTSNVFADGFFHPFHGIDHLLAMLAVGIWSVLRARRIWVAPLCFITMLVVGAVLGQGGLSVPQTEPLVAASVLVLGVMLSVPLRLGNACTVAVIGAFANFHGMAHGGELGVDASVLSGIVLGSALLHAAGMAFAFAFLKQRPQLAKHLGQSVAVFGGCLIISAIVE